MHEEIRICAECKKRGLVARPVKAKEPITVRAEPSKGIAAPYEGQARLQNRMVSKESSLLKTASMLRIQGLLTSPH